MKKFIRLFHLNERSWLEEELNKFINEYDDCDIRVWKDDSGWYAQVMYSYPKPPSYCIDTHSEE
jgi:hypothetical protein